MQPDLLRLHRSSLKKKDACDNLKTVGDAVLHLLQQNFFLSEQLIFLAFGMAAMGYVFYRQ